MKYPQYEIHPINWNDPSISKEVLVNKINLLIGKVNWLTDEVLTINEASEPKRHN